MDFRTNTIIEEYLTQQLDVFTSDDFYKHLRSMGAKVTKADAKEILQLSEYVFSLVNNEYVTKAGVFTGRWFSFKPSREEVEKGYIIISGKIPRAYWEEKFFGHQKSVVLPESL